MYHITIKFKSNTEISLQLSDIGLDNFVYTKKETFLILFGIGKEVAFPTLKYLGISIHLVTNMIIAPALKLCSNLLYEAIIILLPSSQNTNNKSNSQL